MSDIDLIDKEILELFKLNLNDPILQLIKKRAEQQKVYLIDFFVWLNMVNVKDGKSAFAPPTEETVEKTEKEIEAYKRTSDRYDDECYKYDINNEPFR